MRVNCHAHIFNLDSALSEGTLDIIRRRVVEAAVEQDIVNESISKRLGEIVGKRLAEKLAGGPRIDDEKFVRELLTELDQETGLLEEVAKQTSGLPGSFGDAIGGALKDQALLGLRNVVSRLSGLLRRRGDLARGTLTDKIDYLLIAFQSEFDAVVDRIVEQIGPEDGVVALMLDVPTPKTKIADRQADLAFYRRHQAATLRSVLRHPGRVFPFIGVNPLRKGSPSDPTLADFSQIAEKALDGGGFVGVKLYPALGYSPADPALDPVYQYCVDHDVPVMTHASGGGFFASEEDRDFSHPKHFSSVLQNFPKLKLCLAHFGGSSGVKVLNLPKSARKDTLGDTILTLMDRHEGVYTDVSFHEDPMKSPELAAAYFSKLKQLLATDPYRGRILFGTDYWFIRTRTTETGYWRFFEERLTQAEFQRIAESNARSYLGLPRSDGTAASRQMAKHIDYLAANVSKIQGQRSPGRPPEWLLAAAGDHPPAVAALTALRDAAKPSRRLLIRSFDAVLDQMTNRALASTVKRLTPEGGWKIAGADFSFGGLGMAFKGTAQARLAVELFNRAGVADPDGVIGAVLGVPQSGLTSFDSTAWLKYRFEGSLALKGGKPFEPGKLGVGFDADKSVVLCDYRAHRRSETSSKDAIVADLRRPRFALSRRDVLGLGVKDAVSMTVSGKLGARAGLTWSTTLAGNLNRLGRELGIEQPLDVQIGLGASFGASLSVSDVFRVVFSRTASTERPFKVTVRNTDAKGRQASFELTAGAKFADPDVIDAVLSGALGAQLAEVDALLAKSAGALTAREKRLRGSIAERLGLSSDAALATVKQKRVDLEKRAREVIDKIARAEINAGFRFEYSRLEEESVLVEAALSPALMRELHSDLARGDLSVLLERADSDKEKGDIELVSYLHEETVTRSKSWGFSFGFLSRFSSAKDFTLEKTHRQRRGQKEKITYLGRRGYEVKSKKQDDQGTELWSGWKWSGELAAEMREFKERPTTRDFRYAIEMRFEWQKKLGKRRIREIADAAALWKAVETPGVAVKALSDFADQTATVKLALRVRHDALLEGLRIGAGLDPNLAALSLAAAMPCRTTTDDPIRNDIELRRRLYAPVWRQFIQRSRKDQTLNSREWANEAERIFRRLQGTSQPLKKRIGTAAGVEGKFANEKPLSFTFAGVEARHPDLRQDLKALHKALEGSWEAMRPNGTAQFVGTKLQRIDEIYDAIKVNWEHCFQTRALGRYLIDAAARIVGGADLIESSLTIEKDGDARLVGAQQPPERPTGIESVD